MHVATEETVFPDYDMCFKLEDCNLEVLGSGEYEGYAYGSGYGTGAGKALPRSSASAASSVTIECMDGWAAHPNGAGQVSTAASGTATISCPQWNWEPDYFYNHKKLDGLTGCRVPY